MSRILANNICLCSNLSRNELETIPDSALALKQLTILCVPISNSLVLLRLTVAVRCRDLSDNLLSQLNGSFPNVNTLYAHVCTSFDLACCKLTLPYLDRNLSYNAFTAIPDVVFELTELQYLCVESHQPTAITY